MFPVKEFIHLMEGRKCEKLDVNYANTGRLKYSAIPYVQRTLNNNTEKKLKEVLHQEKNPKRKIRKPG